MKLESQEFNTALTSRDRSRRVLYRIAEALRCSPEVILEAASSESYPDATAELVRLWFKLQSDAAREAVLAEARALLTSGHKT